MFLAFILIRLLFVACMVFVIGYVFGPFAKTLALRRITRVAAILAVVLFFISGFWAMHSARGHRYFGDHEKHWCNPDYNDSTAVTGDQY